MPAKTSLDARLPEEDCYKRALYSKENTQEVNGNVSAKRV